MLAHVEKFGHGLVGGDKNELRRFKAGNGGTDLVKEPEAVAVAPLGKVGCRGADVRLHGVVALAKDDREECVEIGL